MGVGCQSGNVTLSEKSARSTEHVLGGPALGAAEDVRFRTHSQIDKAYLSKSNRVSEPKIRNQGPGHP